MKVSQTTPASVGADEATTLTVVDVIEVIPGGRTVRPLPGRRLRNNQ